MGIANKICAKLVMELLHNGMSAREIRKARHVAPASIRKMREAAKEKGLTWDDVADLGDKEVYGLLLSAQVEADEACLAVGYDCVRSELQRDGATLKLLFEEHCDEAAAKGLAHKSRTAFTRAYGGYAAAKNVTSHLEHKPGQAQSTSVFSPHLQPTRIVNALASIHLRCSWQNAEHWHGSPPDATATSQYSFQHSVSVMPRCISSASTFPWSIGSFANRDSALGYSLARIAASPISSGSGHARPAALACFSTSCTVDCAHPHEWAVFAWLTPMALKRRISLYSTVPIPFPRWPQDAPCVPAVGSRKEKPGDAGLGESIGAHRRAMQRRADTPWNHAPISV